MQTEKIDSLNEKYEKIFNLPHHVSERHIQMSLNDRAAQFAPFAALTGFDNEIDEATQKAIEDNMDYVK